MNSPTPHQRCKMLHVKPRQIGAETDAACVIGSLYRIFESSHFVAQICGLNPTQVWRAVNGGNVTREMVKAMSRRGMVASPCRPRYRLALEFDSAEERDDMRRLLRRYGAGRRGQSAALLDFLKRYWCEK